MKAIIDCWYPGARGGKAIAEILFGEYSPCGKLPVTFYQGTENLPEFTDYSMADRTYRYSDKNVLYPFGYGLHYGIAAYTNAEVEITLTPRDFAYITEEGEYIVRPGSYVISVGGKQLNKRSMKLPG